MAVCIACGVVVSLPFRDLDSSLPLWLALAPVFWIVARAKSRWGAALYAFAFALTWTGRSFTFMWNCALEGGIAASLYCAVMYVPALLCVRRIARLGGSAAIFGSAAVWVLTEILRSVLPIVYFPWLLLGHSLLYNAPLRQGADLLGVYGLSFLIAAFNALLAFGLPAIFRRPDFQSAQPSGSGVNRWIENPSYGTNPIVKSVWKNASVLLALIAGFYSYGYERIAKIAPRLKPGATIALIQGNIKTKLGRSNEDFTAQLIRHLELHRKVVADIAAAEGAPPVLVCWAETMVPGNLNTDEWGDAFQKELPKIGIPALAGSNFIEPEDVNKDPDDRRICNTAYLFDANGRELLPHYCKRRLVPFGEYVPYGREYKIMGWLRSVTRDQYVPGTIASPIFKIGGYAIALNICVEDIHPAIAREAAFAGADTLINITNDGWFYGTYGPRAHLRGAAWRAIETRRPLLRVTNTGLTAAVDPLGEINIALPPEKEATGPVKLLRIDNGGSQIVTPYMRLGELWTAAIFAGVLVLSIALRPDKPHGS